MICTRRSGHSSGHFASWPVDKHIATDKDLASALLSASLDSRSIHPPTTTLSDCQSGFIRNLKWLSTNLSYYQSVATIDHFPQLSRLRLRCIERSFTASQFNWMVCLSHLRLGKNVSVAIVSPSTEKSATAHPVPSLCFPAYRRPGGPPTPQQPQRRPGRSR
jgi:hypothetical protein